MHTTPVMVFSTCIKIDKTVLLTIENWMCALVLFWAPSQFFFLSSWFFEPFFYLSCDPCKKYFNTNFILVSNLLGFLTSLNQIVSIVWSGLPVEPNYCDHKLLARMHSSTMGLNANIHDVGYWIWSFYWAYHEKGPNIWSPLSLTYIYRLWICQGFQPHLKETKGWSKDRKNNSKRKSFSNWKMLNIQPLHWKVKSMYIIL